MDPALRELMSAGEDGEVEAIIRLTTPDSVPEGVRIVARFGDIATCRLRRERIAETWADESIVSLKAPRLVAANPANDPIGEEADTSADPEVGDVRRPPELDTTGKGVIVGVIDWGFDFAHDNFRNPDGSTRILALWDQAAADGPAPEPYGYGRVFSREEINRALQQERPYVALGYHPGRSDTKGVGAHGTHVVDIAAGNGRVQGSPVGLAPDADLLLVHLDTRGTGGTANLGDSVTLLEALDWIRDRAGDRPWVVNMSVGRHGGPHTGLTLVEQGIDALLREAPGRAVVQSTGNYYNANAHAAGQLRPGDSRTLRWHLDRADRTPNEMEIWYPRSDEFGVQLQAPSGERLAVSLGRHEPIEIDGRRVGHFYHRKSDPTNGDHHVDVFLHQDAPPGIWSVTLIGEDVVDGRYHCWVERDSSCATCQSRFDPDEADPRCTTGTICNGFRSIAVGAYDSHDEDRPLVRFSSSGPTADGRIKPDLIAPGYRVLAARSTPRESEEPKALLVRNSGTSMAAPHVTGTIANLFEAGGRLLAIHETRRLLLGTAEAIPFHEESGDRVGSGYLDVVRAVEATREWVAAYREVPASAASLGEVALSAASVMETSETVSSEQTGSSPGAESGSEAPTEGDSAVPVDAVVSTEQDQVETVAGHSEASIGEGQEVELSPAGPVGVGVEEDMAPCESAECADGEFPSEPSLTTAQIDGQESPAGLSASELEALEAFGGPELRGQVWESIEDLAFDPVQAGESEESGEEIGVATDDYFESQSEAMAGGESMIGRGCGCGGSRGSTECQCEAVATADQAEAYERESDGASEFADLAQSAFAEGRFTDAESLIDAALEYHQWSGPLAGPDGVPVSVAELFDGLSGVSGQASRRHFTHHFEVVTGPGEWMADEFRRGDLVLERALGEGGLAYATLVTDEGLYATEEPMPHEPRTRRSRSRRRLRAQPRRLRRNRMVVRVRRPVGPLPEPIVAGHGIGVPMPEYQDPEGDFDECDATDYIAVEDDPTQKAGGWVLPGDVRAAGETQMIRYDRAPAWEGGRNCTGSFTAGAAELRRYVLANFAGVRRIGGYNCRQNSASPLETSIHGVGRALDIMIRPIKGRADSAVGDPIANWLVQNASALGVQFIIWNRTTWNGSRRGRKDRRYGGPNPHIDHLHVELNRDGAARRTPWFTSGAASGGTGATEWESETIAELAEAGDDNIRWLQRALNQILGLNLVEDGVAGSQTRAAIKRFQQENGLVPDGIVGSKTAAAIRAALAGAAVPGGASGGAPAGVCTPPGPIPAKCLGIGTREVVDCFDFGSAKILPRHQPKIINIARCIQESQRTSTPITTLRIVSHTDPVGSQAENDRLGQQRADAVKAEIEATLRRMTGGSPPSVTITTETRGERDQLPGDPALSRRAEIFPPFAFRPTPAKPPRPRPPACPSGQSRIRLHLKILTQPTISIATMVASMRQVFGPAGFVVEVASRETLNLPTLEDLDLRCPGVPSTTCCPFPCATGFLNPEHLALFMNRNSVGVNDLAVYFVRSTIPALNGCCAHPPRLPGVIVASVASEWTMAHEIGHVLGLPHVSDSDRLMFDGGTHNITNPPPDLTAGEMVTLEKSALSVPC